MIAELRHTLELARVLDHVITHSEHHHATPPIRAAAARMREGLIEVLRGAIDELADQFPKTDPKEIAAFVRSLDQGRIPAQPQLDAALSLRKEIVVG